MATTDDTLPDTPPTLKAMLLTERVRSERLVQIIKELQRHQFGRRAETLPEDQMLLALEDMEQGKAGAAAESEDKSPSDREKMARKRRMNRGSLPAHLPRVEVIVDIEDKACPCCKGAVARDRRGGLRTSRHSARAIPRAGDAPSKIRVPRLRGSRGSGSL